ncbi:MAG: hypothetical protein Q8930_09045 [Bacillota bacterium]|nr:hypothetical protein [Bacillota bacterium]
MNKKVIFLLAALSLGVLTFGLLKQNSIKDNKVYNVQDKQPPKDITKIVPQDTGTTGNKFYDVGEYEKKLDKDAIFLTVTPDKTHILYMTPSPLMDRSKNRVIKGRTNIDLDIVDWNLSTGIKTNQGPFLNPLDGSAGNSTFITYISWNQAGDKCALGSEGVITHYEHVNGSWKITGSGTTDTVGHFFWSPDSSSNQDTQVLGSSGKKAANLLGKLNEAVYFGITVDRNSVNPLLSTYSTVLTDARGNIIDELAPGTFRDNFGKSVLIINPNRTVSFIKDCYLAKAPIKLTDETVYDSAFVFDGGFYYITEDKESSNNGFILHRMDGNAKEVSTCKISGSSLLLYPDGKNGYVNGEKLEAVDFQNGVVTPMLTAPEQNNDIISVLNSALKDVKNSLMSDIPLPTTYFTAGAYNSTKRLISSAFKGFSDSYKAQLLALNPDVRAVLTSVSMTDDCHAAASVYLSFKLLLIPDVSDIYQIKLVKENGQWKISSIQ